MWNIVLFNIRILILLWYQYNNGMDIEFWFDVPHIQLKLSKIITWVADIYKYISNTMHTKNSLLD